MLFAHLSEFISIKSTKSMKNHYDKMRDYLSMLSKTEDKQNKVERSRTRNYVLNQKNLLPKSTFSLARKLKMFRNVAVINLIRKHKM
jgi:hypothetical protein